MATGYGDSVAQDISRTLQPILWQLVSWLLARGIDCQQATMGEVLDAVVTAVQLHGIASVPVRTSPRQGGARPMVTISVAQQRYVLQRLQDVGVTQRTIAQACHVSEATVSRWYHGQFGMRPIYLATLSTLGY